MESLKTKPDFNNLVESLIKILALSFLMIWCFLILQPFLLILVWAAVIAIAIHPLLGMFIKLFRGRKALAVVMLTISMLSIVIVPSSLIVYSLYDGLGYIREAYDSGSHIIPPPGETTKDWPQVAQPIVEFWKLASDNLQGALLKYADQAKEIGKWVFGTLAGVGKGILLFCASIIIAGVLLAYADSLEKVSKDIFQKLAGNKGSEFTEVTVMTVRNVIKGILGVAFIQATMAGAGFFVAGVPFAGLWTVLCLILSIVQIGAGPIAIPIIIYMFSVSDVTTASILAIWLIITLVSDNVLKPILLGRNAPAPMLVIFLGAIGGFIFNGFLGLFLGAVILTLGYKLFLVWLEHSNSD